MPEMCIHRLLFYSCFSCTERTRGKTTRHIPPVTPTPTLEEEGEDRIALDQIEEEQDLGEGETPEENLPDLDGVTVVEPENLEIYGPLDGEKDLTEDTEEEESERRVEHPVVLSQPSKPPSNGTSPAPLATRKEKNPDLPPVMTSEERREKQRRRLPNQKGPQPQDDREAVLKTLGILRQFLKLLQDMTPEQIAAMFASRDPKNQQGVIRQLEELMLQLQIAHPLP